jgi:hypothetical protein
VPEVDSGTDLAGVRAFVAVADREHLARAAETLGVGRNTVAARLTGYERHVGRTLIDRSHGRVVTLTAAGQALLPAARELLAAAAAHDRYARAVGTGSSGIVRIAVRVERHGLIDLLLLAVEAVNPRWQVEVQTRKAIEIGRGLIYGELDAALTPRRPGAPYAHHLERPNNHEEIDGLRIGDYGSGLYVSWRARWTGPHTGALIETARAVAAAQQRAKVLRSRERLRRESALATADLLAGLARRHPRR